MLLKLKIIKSKLRSQFIYIVVPIILFLVLMGSYLGYLEFSSHEHIGNIDECKRLNPPISCLFK